MLGTVYRVFRGPRNVVFSIFIVEHGPCEKVAKQKIINFEIIRHFYEKLTNNRVVAVVFQPSNCYQRPMVTI